MVEVLVILDGASEPLGSRPTSLERARTPTLDWLASEGRLDRVRTVPHGLPAGSESAIPTLLGWAPRSQLDRGALEAAAREVPLGDGERAWRIDAVDPDGRRAGPRRTAAAARDLRARAPRHRVVRLAGHRLLLCGLPPRPPLPDGLRSWPEGLLPPVLLDGSTTVVAAAGAAAGLGRLMGARVLVPAGATGGPDTDLGSKASVALDAVGAGAERVIVHFGGPDEAAHERDPDGKVEAIERADGELLAPLAEGIAASGGWLVVSPDHGCDPLSGRHDPSPVPSVTWAPRGGRGRGPGRRLTERAVAAEPVREPVLAGALPA